MSKHLIPALMLACAVAPVFATAASTQEIVNGPSMRLAGTYTFQFVPASGAGPIWSVDRETVSDAGVHTRTNGILSHSGPIATFALSHVGGAETIYYINATDAGVFDCDTVQVFPSGTRTWFTYRSAGNPDVRVYAVFPATASAASHVVLAMHGNSRTASSYADYWRTWANQHDYIVLCPYYDLVNWPTTGNYQMGNVFSGDDCEGVRNPEVLWSFTIDEGIHRRVREGFALEEPFYDMWGFSGGGQHVHRFLLFKPHAAVRLAIAAGSGWYTAPDPNIDCPYGPRDPLLHFTHQDLIDWTHRTMIIMVGTADTVRDADLRTTPRAEAQGRNRYERAQYMHATGVAFDPATRWDFIDVPDVGHEAQPMAQAAQIVLQGVSVGVSRRPQPGVDKLMLTIGPNPITSATVLRGEGWTSDRAVEIAIYDLGGRMIATDSAPVIDGRWHIAWSRIPGTARISKGVYLIRATDGEHRAARKVLILR